MTVRGWQLVLLATLIALLTSTRGMALVVYLLAWWAVCIFFGGLVIRGMRNPLRGFGEEPPPRL